VTLPFRQAIAGVRDAVDGWPGAGASGRPECYNAAMSLREFNTSGPCDPKLHYTVPRTEVVARGIEQIEKGRFFTIFAPRQAGKTTCFQMMLAELAEREGYVGTWISTEDLRSAPPEIFWRKLSLRLGREFEIVRPGFEPPEITSGWDLEEYAVELKRQTSLRWVLIIDEFEGVPPDLIGDLMHHFRQLYHKRATHALQSLIVVGVRNITEANLDHASPFNIAEEVEIPYFTRAEVEGLVGQYVEEAGQEFDRDVVRQVYSNTAGQPGLACAVCRDLVERFATDRSKPVTMDAFWPMLQYYLSEKIDKNISNIINKARQEPALMLKVLFNSEVPFRIDDPATSFLYVNGVIANEGGIIDVPVPLYKKRLISAFSPLINGELEHYTTLQTDFSAFLDGDGLNVPALIESYRQYVRRRGFRAFDTENLKEGAWHYSLDGYISFFVERLGHHSFVEVPTGRGRTDILIVWGRRSYIIETKVFTDNHTYQNGKRQLAEYLKSEGLEEGCYVVFSSKHTEADTLLEDEQIDGRRILTYVIRTNLEPASA